jgi:hypothetical protein
MPIKKMSINGIIWAKKLKGNTIVAILKFMMDGNTNMDAIIVEKIILGNEFIISLKKQRQALFEPVFFNTIIPC